MICDHCGENRGLVTCQACTDELRAIVDKLPKCWRLNERGELLQDVPVVPGMEVWFWLNDEAILVHQKAVQFVEDNQQSIMTSYGWLNVRHCYSTREAAEAAEGEA